jgi:hypothetical protein
MAPALPQSPSQMQFINPAQDNTLAIFNQKLQQNGMAAEWPAESVGPAHALRWNVKCVGEWTLTFYLLGMCERCWSNTFTKWVASKEDRVQAGARIWRRRKRPRWPMLKWVSAPSHNYDNPCNKIGRVWYFLAPYPLALTCTLMSLLLLYYSQNFLVKYMM